MTRPLLATSAVLVCAAALAGCLPSSPRPPEGADLALGPMDMGASDVDMTDVTFIPPEQLTARAYFDRFVLPSLTATCKACHGLQGGAGPGWMIGANGVSPYQTMIKYPGFINDPPELSLLLRKGPHDGTEGLKGTNSGCTDQCGLVLTWLQKEKVERDRVTPPTRSPQTAPFFPRTDGPYTKVQLREINPLFDGAYLNFKATLLPNNKGVEISDLRLYNISTDPAALGDKRQRTIQMVHPLFSVWKGITPTPDPVDNFSSLDRTIRLYQDDSDPDGKVRSQPSADPPPVREGVLLVPGLFTLSTFRAGDALNVAFVKFDLLPPIPGDNPCTAQGLQKFNNIRPFLAKTNGANTNCGTRTGCHTAESAVAGLDLSAALQAPAAGAESTAYKALCERLKFYNQTGVMLDNTDPLVTDRHPTFKYTDTVCNGLVLGNGCHAAFKAAVQAMKSVDP